MLDVYVGYVILEMIPVVFFLYPFNRMLCFGSIIFLARVASSHLHACLRKVWWVCSKQTRSLSHLSVIYLRFGQCGEHKLDGLNPFVSVSAYAFLEENAVQIFIC